MSLVKSVNLPGGAQAQTFVVMSNQKTNNGTVVSSAVPVMTQNVVQSKFVVLFFVNASVSYWSKAMLINSKSFFLCSNPCYTYNPINNL